MARCAVAGYAAALAILVPTSGDAEEPMAGEAIYKQRCVTCHQPSGEGLPGSFPPINDTLGHFMAVESGRHYLTDAIVFGLGGTITVGGKRYIGQMKVVPPLSDQEAADVLNYVLRAFNSRSLPAHAKPFDAAEIADRRAAPKVPTALAKTRQDVVAELQGLGLSR